jgi:subtilisin-like proprotein convertase family protein
VLAVLISLLLTGAVAAQDGGRVIARGAESYGPVTPLRTVALRDLDQAAPWRPGDPIKEVPRRFFPVPGDKQPAPAEGLPDPLLERQLARKAQRAPTITPGVNFEAQGFSGATPPDTVGDVGPSHYVQAVNASRIAVYDKTGALLPGFPIDLDSLAPSGACTSGAGDPIVLYDWLADRWLLQEFTGGGTLCLYVSTTADPTGTYHFYSFTPPSFPDYPHYGVWPDAYYATTNEAGGGGNQTTYAFDRVAMLAGAAATMQRLTVVPPVTAYGFQTLTAADHDGAAAPPGGAPGIFMRHYDDEAHDVSPSPAIDYLEMWEMSVDFANAANTTVTALPRVAITDFNSWMINYTTFFSTSQPGSGTLLDAIREVILQRLVYRNFGTHEALLGVFATNRDPATSGSNVEQGSRWFELRRSGGGWALHDEGTFGGDTNSASANFFMGSVAMDAQGNVALGYSKTDVGASPVFPSLGFTGRLAGDPAGTLAPENDAVLGGAASSSGRWGDYAAMSVDPADDCTFWFTSEYIPGGPTGGSWGTRIASFAFDECMFRFDVTATPDQLDVCAPTDPDPAVSVDVTSVGGWSFAVGLAASGEPPGTTSTFVPDNQLPDFTSTYTLLGTGGSTTGVYPIDITGTGGDVPPTVRSTQFVLNLAVADPGPPALTTPVNGTIGVSLQPTFTWTAGTDVTSYDLEVATDAAFTNVVYSVTGLTGLSHSLPSALDPSSTYHWRLTAVNVCGTVTTGAFSFTTIPLACETFPSADVPLPIPEGSGTSGTTTSTLTIGAGDGGTIADVNVLDLIGTHTYMDDLDIFVESPTATSVQLREQACGALEDFDLNYDDQAAPGPPPCPPTDGGTYQPDSPLAAFDGEDSTGTWTLSIIDNFTGDVGQLDSWGLEVCIETCLDSPIVVSNQTISDDQLRATCSSITVGPTVTVAGAGSLDLIAPTIEFVDVVKIEGELSARTP